MAQIRNLDYENCYVNTTANSSTIDGENCLWLSWMKPGDNILIGTDAVYYTVAYVVNDNQAVLLSAYPVTLTDADFVLNTDFTPNMNLPYVENGDYNFPESYNRSMELIDTQYGMGLDWQEPVRNMLDAAPESPSGGDRYIVGAAVETGNAWEGYAGYIAEWIAGSGEWAFTSPATNMVVFNQTLGVIYLYSIDWIVWNVTNNLTHTSGTLTVNNVFRQQGNYTMRIDGADSAKYFEIFGDASNMHIRGRGTDYTKFSSLDGTVWLVSATTKDMLLDCGGKFYFRDVDDVNALGAWVRASTGEVHAQGSFTVGYLSISGKTISNTNVEVDANSKIVLVPVASSTGYAGVEVGTSLGALSNSISLWGNTSGRSSIWAMDGTDTYFSSYGGHLRLRAVTTGGIYLAPYGTSNVVIGDVSTGPNLVIGQSGTSALNRHVYMYSGSATAGRYMDIFQNADQGCGITGCPAGTMSITSGYALNLSTAASTDMSLIAGGIFKFLDKDAANASRMELDSATGALTLNGVATTYGSANSILAPLVLKNANDGTSAGSAIQFRFGSANNLGAQLLQGYNSGAYLAATIGSTEVQRWSATQAFIYNANIVQDGGGNLNLYTTDAFAIDKGGKIGLGGKFNTAGTQYVFGTIRGAKENATDGNYAGYLSLSTVIAGGTVVERMRISSVGLVSGAKYAITPEGGWAIKLTNKTGGTSVPGRILTMSTGTDNAYEQAAAGEDFPIGICYDAVAADAEGWVVVAGIADVDYASAPSRDSVVYCGATAGRASSATSLPGVTDHNREIGHVLSATATSGTLYKTVLHFN